MPVSTLNLLYQIIDKKILLKDKVKRSIINRYLLRSVCPIIKATLKEPFVKGIKGKDFFSQEMLLTLTHRINGITSQSKREWGTISPDQMLHHLNLPMGTALGYYELPDKSYLLSRTVFKWLLVDFLSEQPKGLQLPLNFKIPPPERFDLEDNKKYCWK
ncbi:hypothetical protein A0O34_17725 [Chryseobacterium glaciei]|uniref:Uncharacterized protein n=1 Tax=Chryseobacterium glaciei TaxID=1685010 RepID=A0A172XZI5_9FLAO|nr:hypothetical protein [Chryseobacterium glaciei]ANF52245.1 hypothetical protein A0O34_17725 [Chryseobacterium glaciei]